MINQSAHAVAAAYKTPSLLPASSAANLSGAIRSAVNNAQQSGKTFQLIDTGCGVVFAPAQVLKFSEHDQRWILKFIEGGGETRYYEVDQLTQLAKQEFKGLIYAKRL